MLIASFRILDFCIALIGPVDWSVFRTGLASVNSLSPSGIFQNDMSESFVSKLSALTPMNRLINKEELIQPIQFLSNKENSFITGQNIIIDGGRSII